MNFDIQTGNSIQPSDHIICM